MSNTPTREVRPTMEVSNGAVNYLSRSQEEELKVQQEEMRSIQQEVERFWTLCIRWYIGGGSFFLYLVLLGFLQVDEFRKILDDTGWFFFAGVGAMGFVLLFIIIILVPVIFGDIDTKVWNSTYSRATSKKAKIKFKKGNATYALMQSIGMKGQMKFDAGAKET
jgi:hypothetical protein